MTFNAASLLAVIQWAIYRANFHDLLSKLIFQFTNNTGIQFADSLCNWYNIIQPGGIQSNH